MPIIICPECRGQVSTTLNSCPHCGFVITSKSGSGISWEGGGGFEVDEYGGRYDFAAFSAENGSLSEFIESLRRRRWEVVLSPDRSKLAAECCCDLHIWDTTTGQIVLSARDASDGMVWSPDGTKLASFFGGSSRVWDVARGYKYPHSYQHREGMWQGSREEYEVGDAYIGDDYREVDSAETHSIVWSPDGGKLASCARLGMEQGEDDLEELAVWDVGSGKEIFYFPAKVGSVNWPFSNISWSWVEKMMRDSRR